MTLRTVLLNEWRLLAADRALRVVLGVFAVLFVYALANGMAWARFQERTVEAGADRQRRARPGPGAGAGRHRERGAAVVALPRPPRPQRSRRGPGRPHRGARAGAP